MHLQSQTIFGATNLFIASSYIYDVVINEVCENVRQNKLSFIELLFLFALLLVELSLFADSTFKGLPLQEITDYSSV